MFIWKRVKDSLYSKYRKKQKSYSFIKKDRFNKSIWNNELKKLSKNKRKLLKNRKFRLKRHLLIPKGDLIIIVKDD